MTDFIDISDLDEEGKELIQIIVNRLKRGPVRDPDSDREAGPETNHDKSR